MQFQILSFYLLQASSHSFRKKYFELMDNGMWNTVNTVKSLISIDLDFCREEEYSPQEESSPV